MKRIKHAVLTALSGLVLASCGASAPAYADTRIGAHLGSYHFQPGFNNSNPGVYVYHNGWTGGTYYNSERKQSVYAGYTFEYPLVGPFTAGLTVGAITGYARAQVLPLAIPSISWKVSDASGVSVRLSFVPPVDKTVAAVHASIEWRFR